MTFALSDRLLLDIVSALDNQDATFLVEAETESLVEASADSSLKADSENYYELPEWNSSDGFKIREDFTNDLNSPIVKEELKEVLHSGRGVFRNFRNVLKQYPEVEKRWHIYKNRRMHSYINDWYNGLREVWGLERLDYIPESDENLVHDDFSFRQYNSSSDYKEIILHVNETFYNEHESMPEILKSALYEMWKAQFEQAEASEQFGLVCHSLSEEFAGCITASAITKNQEQVYKVTCLFVPEQYRGLGIGTELLEMCLLELKKRGKYFILMPDIIVPETIEPLLLRNGFEKIGSGYAATLQ